MVKRGNQCTPSTRSKQGPEALIPEPNKIASTTHFDFEGKNLTAYGGLLPVATMLEKLGFQQLVEESVRVKRVTRVMSLYQFILSMGLALYVGLSRLNHLRFVERGNCTTGTGRAASKSACIWTGCSPPCRPGWRRCSLGPTRGSTVSTGTGRGPASSGNGNFWLERGVRKSTFAFTWNQ